MDDNSYPLRHAALVGLLTGLLIGGVVVIVVMGFVLYFW